MKIDRQALWDRAGRTEAPIGGARADLQHDTGAVSGRPKAWQGRSAAGIAGSVIASLCCLPAAAAAALGLGLGTVAGLSQLLEYQRFFQVGGLAFAGLTVWRMLRKSSGACDLSERHRERLPLLVMGSFALSFLVLNVVVIPLLERAW